MSAPRGQLTAGYLRAIEQSGIAAATLTLSVVCGTLALIAFPSLRQAVGIGQPVLDAGYVVGDQIDLPVDQLNSAGSTAALFVRESCSACQQVAPLLRRFVADVSARNAAQLLLVIGRSSPERDRRFLRELGAQSRQILHVDFRQLRLRSVPTLVVINHAGTITFVRAGSLSADDLEAARRVLETSP